MKYTILGKTGLRVSRLGFGCMRLPMDSSGHVNRKLAIPLLQRAFELGINYFDTAVFYCNGDSQKVLGEAFEKKRDKVIFSAKNHLHEATKEAWWEKLEESLKSLRTSYIDIYNFHGISWSAWQQHISPPKGKLSLMLKAKEQGLIRHICCSFHDSPEALKKLADTGVFESITLQYNLLDRTLEEAIEYCHKNGIGIVVMGPVGGGRLSFASKKIKDLIGENVSTPEAAFRFVLGSPNVDVALSGMSNIQMLEENVKTVSEKPPLSTEQLKKFDAKIESIRQKIQINCTGCAYCQPCPAGVDIPGNFRILTEYQVYGLRKLSEKSYANLVEKASACTECGACIPKCPQKINIPRKLRETIKQFDKDSKPFGALLNIHKVMDKNTAKCVLITRNTSNKVIAGKIHFYGNDEEIFKPSELKIDIPPVDKGIKRHFVKTLLPDGTTSINGKAIIMAGKNKKTLNFHLPFFIIPEGEPRKHIPKITACDLNGNEEAARTHNYTVLLSHDKKAIFMKVDIRSQLSCPAQRGETRGDRLELYIDMRPHNKGFRSMPYTEGAEQFILSFVDQKYATKSGQKYSLKQKNIKTPTGLQMEIEIPFYDFIKKRDPLPSVIGLDIMFVVATKDGLELGYPTYGGKSGLWQNPRLFCKAWII